MKLVFLFLGFSLFLSSCSKDEAVYNAAPSPPLPPASNIGSPTIDSLPFPLKTGTWWKYKRVDTSNVYNRPPIKDSSIEVVTVKGKIKITDSVEATRLHATATVQVRHFTAHTLAVS